MLPWELTPADVQAMQTAGEDFLLLDVREPREHDHARIAGATLIPMGQIADRIDELAPWKSKRIVVHCHHGGRSMRVTQWLRQQGYDQAQNMAGGIDVWSTTVDGTVPRY